jgi:hypothetical protein
MIDITLVQQKFVEPLVETHYNFGLRRGRGAQYLGRN